MSRLDITVAFTRSFLAEAREAQITFLAAAIAYYAFVSIVPLLLVGLAVATAVGGEGFATMVVTGVEGVLTPEASDVLGETLLSSEGRESATVVGVVVLLWSGLRVFRSLDIAFARIYDSRRASLVDQAVDAVVVLGAMAGAIVLTVIVSAWLPLAGVPWAGFLGTLGVALVLPVVFYPLYYVFPDVPLSPVEAVPGAVVAGGGWTVLATAFSVYASYAGIFSLYGVLGGVLLLLTWFYFGSMLVLLGALLNAKLSGRFRDRQVQQAAPPRDAQ
ncbi:YihY/virulence factor BrkB family protein [Halobacteriales archaeon Cl-PHB]